MKYSDLINELQDFAEVDFAKFQRRLIPTKQKIIGVRTPIMRRIAKKYAVEIDKLLCFPNEYYEVTFIKLTAVSLLPYEKFAEKVESCVSFIDNWAACDCFKAKCIQKNQDAFLPVIEKIFLKGGEFEQRYALVTLLSFYVEEKYLQCIESYILQADTKPYYVHMAVAWLTAEILVKYFDFGVQLLKKGILQRKTHNKSIQKAIESYRLTNEQKEFLRSLKIK